MARRVVILDPTGRHSAELSRVATASGLVAQVITGAATPEDLTGADLVLASVGAASVLPEPVGPGAGPEAPRWVYGDTSDAGKLAGAAVACGATGVLVLPVTAASFAAIAAPDPVNADGEHARLRSLLAASLLDEGDAHAPLVAIAGAFTADDCIVWWRDGDVMAPRAARPAPDDGYRGPVSTASRIAAATGATAIVPAGGGARSVIAAPLRTGPHEVAGLVAIVADRARRFTAGERTDLRALGARLTRELQHLASYRRVVAEDERLRAGSLHDPLTSALTRTAFEQAVANEIAAAYRRGETLSLVFLDIVGLRRINLQHGHRHGDEVLAQVANRVRAAVRGTDLLGRFGGDELALLLINAPVDQARGVAEKVLARVTGTAIPFEGGAQVQVAVRAVVTPIARNERSGEASFARALGLLRSTKPDQVAVAAADTRAPDAEMPLEHAALGVGTTLGGTYRILHELSRGAMGVVYRGEDIGLGRAVAIKVLRSDLASDAELVGRFRAEAAMLASLHHPHLVQVYALGEHTGDVYFVMELVEGQPLSEVIRTSIDRGEWLPLPAVAQITSEVADALDAMHHVGLIHRDVKPGNVLLDRERGRAVLVDVGVATKAGGRGEGAGTPGFAAPESFIATDETSGESVETDVYGLAATAYAMLTGRTPFGAGTVMAVVNRQLNERLPPASGNRRVLTRAVDEVLAKALDPTPSRRWASASAFAIALAAALERCREEPRERPPITAVEAVMSGATGGSTRQPQKPADQAAAMVTDQLPPGALAAAAHDATVAAPRKRAPSSRIVVNGDLRGAHFRVAARGLSTRVGGAAVRNLVEASPLLARVLSPSLPALGWEPVSAFLTLLDHARPHMPPEDLARMVGRATIHATFARMFGANPASLPVETVLRAAPAFWGRYHTWSRLAVRASAPQLIELSLQYAALRGPAGAVPALCELVSAQLARVAELAGAREAAVDHSTCRALGGDECRFIVTWV